MGPVYLNTGHWTHTFVLDFNLTDPLSKVTLLQEISSCPNLTTDVPDSLPENTKIRTFMRDFLVNNFCHFVQNVNSFINNLRSKLNNSISNLKSEITQGIPQNKHINFGKTKSKRQVFALGVLSLVNTFFGAKNHHDIKKVTKHVNSLGKQFQDIQTRQFMHNRKFNSFVHLTTNTFDNIFQAINETTHQFLDFKNLTYNMEEVNLKRNYLLLNVLNDMELQIALNLELSKLEIALDDLLKGHLSHVLIDFETVHKTAQNINKQLINNNSPFRVDLKSPHHFFTHTHFTYHRISNLIYLNVEFPLVNFDYSAQLYENIFIDLPLNASKNHVSRLANNHKSAYFALTNDNTYISFVSTHEFQTSGNYQNLILHYSQNSCIFNIFVNDLIMIKKLCDYEIELNFATQTIVHIHLNLYYVINIPNYDLTCNNSIQNVDACSGDTNHKYAACLIKIECGCTVNNEKLLLPPQEECFDSYISTDRKKYIINLAAALEFHGDIALKIDTSAKHSDIPIVELFSDDDLRHLIDKTHGNILSLREFARKISEEKQKPFFIYKMLSSPTDILSLVNSALIFIIILGIIIVACKYYKLILFVISLQNQVNEARATPISLTFPSDDVIHAECEETGTIDTTYWVILIIALLTPLMMKLISNCFYNKYKSNVLCFMFCTESESIIIPLIKLKNCAFIYHFKTFQNISDFSITGSFWKSCLKFKINDFEISSFFDNRQKIDLPESVPLSMYKSFKLKRMFKERSNVMVQMIATFESNVLYKINVCSLHCIRCELKNAFDPLDIIT